MAFSICIVAFFAVSKLVKAITAKCCVPIVSKVSIINLLPLFSNASLFSLPENCLTKEVSLNGQGLNIFGCLIVNCSTEGAFQIFVFTKICNFEKPKQLIMSKAEYLELASSRYDKFQELNKIDNFYDYEVQFVNILNDLGREILEKNLGALVKDKRKKKPYDFGLSNNQQQS